MEHQKKDYEKPAMDVIEIRRLNLLAGSTGATEDPPAREYYYTDPFHYLYDINE